MPEDILQVAQLRADECRSCPLSLDLSHRQAAVDLGWLSAGRGTPFREPIEELLVQRRSRPAIRPVPRIPGRATAHAQPALCATVA